MKRTVHLFLLVATLWFLFAACSTSSTTTTTQTATTTTKHSKPSTSLQVTGLVHTPATLALADLQAFSKVTITTSVQPLGKHTFGGALLYDVLQKAQITVDSTHKNDILRKAVLVSGTDGYTVAISLGEIAPKFAGKQVLLAYEEDGKPLPQTDGFTRLVVPGDQAAGRYVSNVAKVQVLSPGPIVKQGMRGPSSMFFLVGAVNTPTKYDLAALKVLKTTEVTVQTQGQNGQTTTTTYGGVLLNDLLNSAGIQINKQSKNDILHKGIIAVGSDGYSALVVGGEISPKFADNQILVALTMDGKPLGDSDGFARLVVPGDSAAGRFVSNLVELQVIDISGS